MSRLPRNLKPSHYELNLNLDLDGLIFQGSVTTHLEVIEQTTSIILHSDDLEFISTKIEHPSGEVTGISAVEYDKKKDTITIPLDNPLPAESKILLHQSYHGKIKKYGETAGLHWSSYKDPDGKDKRFIFTTCQPIGARSIFPCLDEPDFKATISSTVTLNQDLTCMSNMDVASSEVTSSGTGEISKRIAFNTTPRTSTYIICFVIGDLDSIESTRLKFPVRVHALKGAQIQRGAKMLDLAVRALALYEDLFGLGYPLPKLDLVALPGAGGLENWGCVVFGERFVLLDAGTTATKNWQTACETLCHEMAHQWFGNLVTMAWWDDLWLSEAFAEWAGFYVVDRLFPDWQYWLNFVAADADPEAMPYYQGALDIDSGRGSHPIYFPDASPNRMHEFFDNVTYMKGASILRMLSQSLGPETFIAGIKDYLKRHAFSNATRIDLWDSLSAASGRDVGRLMREWTEAVGYPVLLVSEDPASGTITLEQHRYLQSVEVTAEEDETLYQVPLNIKTSTSAGNDNSNKSPSTLSLTSRKQKYHLSEPNLEFYKLNAGNIGLYRVSYPPSRLRRFGSQMRSLHMAQLLSPEDRVGLISDTHALISSVSYSSLSNSLLESDTNPTNPIKLKGTTTTTTTTTADLLDFFLALGESPDNKFIVWRQLFYTLAKIQQAFFFSPASPRINEWLRRFHGCLLLVPRPYDSDAWWKIEASDPMHVQNEKALFFSQAVAAYDSDGDHHGGYAVLHRIATVVAPELFDKYIAATAENGKPDTIAKKNDVYGPPLLNPNIRKYVFQAVAKSNDVDRFNALLNLSLTTSDPEIRTDAFVALGYATSPSSIQQALAQMTLPNHEPFSMLEKWFLLNALRTHRDGAAAAWAWFRATWPDLVRKGGPHNVSSWGITMYMASCTAALSTEEQLWELERLRWGAEHKYNKDFDEAVEGIKARKAWVARDYRGVEDWLTQNMMFRML